MVNVYPGAGLYPADPTNYRVARRGSFDLVVIHITDGHAHAVNVAEMWKTPHHKSSAHFVVGQLGEILQCVDLGDVAYHATRINDHSVGIEHCARTPGELGAGDVGLPPSDKLYAASARLCAWLLRLAGLPVDRDHVKGHCEAAPWDDHDDCPNAVWDWPRYMGLVAAEHQQLGGGAPG